MNELSVRDLKAKASQVLRQVREQGKRYIITHRGRPVAVLTPVSSPADLEKTDTVASEEEKWRKFHELGEQVGREWKSKETSTEIISSMRR